MQSDGLANIAAGSTEMGQGVRTTLTQIAAEELTLPMESFRLLGADTKTTPYDSSTGSTSVQSIALSCNRTKLLRYQLIPKVSAVPCPPVGLSL